MQTHHRCDVLLASDAIGMGLNLAIRRVVLISMQVGTQCRCTQSWLIQPHCYALGACLLVHSDCDASPPIAL